jgi:hypothetical protein
LAHQKITAADYYDFMPSEYHRPGDLWTGLPSHGLLPSPSVTGLIVTPACDLSQRKVDTLTYLPVVTVSEWLVTSEFRADIVGQIKNAFGSLKSTAGRLELSRRPTRQELEEAAAHAELARSALGSDKSQAALVERIMAGIVLLARSSPESDSKHFEDLFGKKPWRQTLDKLVKNGLRLDVHFLPPDEQDPVWSCLETPSLVLFRYPLTLPVQILDIASDIGIKDWAAAMADSQREFPIATAFSTQRPIRRLRVKERFLADIMTRYLAVYIRLGSPDFTQATVDSYVETIAGGR